MVDETTAGNEPPAEEQKFDRAFFLALAAKGKEAWNACRFLLLVLHQNPCASRTKGRSARASI
jgi:hypothetical protein